ncbi:AEC family transporter [Saccharibacillus sp. CPCC 101409]|uniref:AEC family transporter n=1 Tax=Saccharibacillus sp. CPCC 101409 TaxID=3058041 RepID=UPI002670EDFD|nr:AEC family transporter [Saccharibacillus sp. CPCC 101409]MDO3410795.1 AEC family transporter [Saccharibacillus sp. CPCC 101409]
MLLSIFATMYHVFLPLSFPVVAGILLRRFRGLDTKPLSVLSLYVLSPSIIFSTLIGARVSASDVGITVSFGLLNLLAMWGVSVLLGRLLKLGDAEKAGLTLVSSFTNCVNYGLPLVLLAFGQAGLDKAAVYVVMQIVIVNTIGVFFAARSQFSIKRAGLAMLKLPALYVAALAGVLRLAEVTLPPSVHTGVNLLSGAYSPVVLVILGAQMIGAAPGAWQPNLQKAFRAGLALRLLIAPLLSWLILLALGAEPLLLGVLLVLASMPTAVNAVILAEQFGASPKFVSRCILWTTMASFILLPLLLVWTRT